MERWGHGIKEMVQARPTIYRVIGLKRERKFMGGRDEFSAMTGKLR